VEDHIQQPESLQHDGAGAHAHAAAMAARGVQHHGEPRLGRAFRAVEFPEEPKVDGANNPPAVHERHRPHRRHAQATPDAQAAGPEQRPRPRGASRLP
jgi:hypothetical protein